MFNVNNELLNILRLIAYTYIVDLLSKIDIAKFIKEDGGGAGWAGVELEVFPGGSGLFPVRHGEGGGPSSSRWSWPQFSPLLALKYRKYKVLFFLPR